MEHLSLPWMSERQNKTNNYVLQYLWCTMYKCTVLELVLPFTTQHRYYTATLRLSTSMTTIATSTTIHCIVYVIQCTKQWHGMAWNRVDDEQFLLRVWSGLDVYLATLLMRQMKFELFNPDIRFKCNAIRCDIRIICSYGCWMECCDYLTRSDSIRFPSFRMLFSHISPSDFLLQF